MSAPDGGPAFPTKVHGNEGVDWVEPGMTLRDWFAGQALAGWVSDPELTQTYPEVARGCYEFADAMIIERGE